MPKLGISSCSSQPATSRVRVSFRFASSSVLPTPPAERVRRADLLARLPHAGRGSRRSSCTVGSSRPRSGSPLVDRPRPRIPPVQRGVSFQNRLSIASEVVGEADARGGQIPRQQVVDGREGRLRRVERTDRRAGLLRQVGSVSIEANAERERQPRPGSPRVREIGAVVRNPLSDAVGDRNSSTSDGGAVAQQCSTSPGT